MKFWNFEILNWKISRHYFHATIFAFISHNEVNFETMMTDLKG